MQESYSLSYYKWQSNLEVFFKSGSLFKIIRHQDKIKYSFRNNDALNNTKINTVLTYYIVIQITLLITCKLVSKENHFYLSHGKLWGMRLSSHTRPSNRDNSILCSTKMIFSYQTKLDFPAETIATLWHIKPRHETRFESPWGHYSPWTVFLPQNQQQNIDLLNYRPHSALGDSS